MNTRFHSVTILGIILIITLLMTSIGSVKGSTLQQTDIPSGFSISASGIGVQLYKDNSGSYPHYVQIVSLDQGASIKLPYGDIADPGTGSGVYGGDNPIIYRQTLRKYWNDFVSINSNAFCITNGQFFVDNINGQIIDPTNLAFPLKVDGEIISDGYGITEYQNQKLMLVLWSDRSDIVSLSKENLLSSSAPNIIAGLSEYADKGINNFNMRTFVGIDDQNGDGKYEKVLVYNSGSSTQPEAGDILRSFGADKVIMLDGGGSTQLICRGQDIITSFRAIPQAFAVLEAPRYENSATVMDISNPDSYSCSQPGYVDFEGFPELTDLTSGTVAGMRFITTGGQPWRVGDFATGNYNGKYPGGSFTSHDTHWVWLGTTQGSGRINFEKGNASYFSLLVSNYSPVTIDAFDANGNLLATAGPAPTNAGTGHMAELKITRAVPDIAYVMVHDTGNYWLVDDVCTNAPGTPNTINRVLDQTYYMQTGDHSIGSFILNLITGFWKYLRIFIGPFGSDVDLILTRPDGSIVSPGDPGVTFTKTGNYIEVIIEGAAAGEWNYEIVANQLEDGGENIRITVDEQLIAVENEPPVLDPVNEQTVQYSDYLEFSLFATDSDDPGDSLLFTATDLPDSLALTDNGDGTATVSGFVNAVPDTYNADITVTDPDGNTDTESVTIIVSKEDLRATYTGPVMVSTGCESCSYAVIPLRATIQDITELPDDPAYDPDPGIITNATVSFVNRSNGELLCSSDVFLLDPSIQTVGTASCDWTADLGSGYGVDYIIGVVVDGYYTRNSTEDDTLVVVSKPSSNFITGGGYFINQNSSGTYGGTSGLKTNFGINIKFNQKFTNLIGHVTIIVRQNAHIYQIKSTALSSLVVVPYNSTDPKSGKAELVGKATITDVTNSQLPVPVEGNATLNIVMKDNGEPGTTDLLGISLWSKNKTLLYSSNWIGTKTEIITIDGGNVNIK